MAEKKEKPAEAQAAPEAEKPAAAPKPAAGSGKGNDSNLIAAFGYLTGAGFVIPLLIYLVKKEDRFVKFHSLQSMLLWLATWFVFGVFQVLTMVLGMLGPLAVLACVTGLASFLVLCAGGIASLYAAYKVFEGEDYELPHFGAMARKQV